MLGPRVPGCPQVNSCSAQLKDKDSQSFDPSRLWLGQVGPCSSPRISDMSLICRSNWGAGGTRREATRISYLNHVATLLASYCQAQLVLNPFGFFIKKLMFLYLIRFASLVRGGIYSSGVSPWSASSNEPPGLISAASHTQPLPSSSTYKLHEVNVKNLGIDDNRCTLYHYIIKSNESFNSVRKKTEGWPLVPLPFLTRTFWVSSTP